MPGDGIDQDCVGGDAPIPVLKRTVAYKLGYGKAFTMFSSLRVKPARKGDKISFACKGKGCTRKKAKVKVKKNGASVSLTRFVKDARLKPGTQDRDPDDASGERRPLPPLHDPLGQAAQADAPLPGARLVEAGRSAR